MDIINKLEAFAKQRPGLERANYGHGDFDYYGQDARKITQQLRDAKTLLSYIRSSSTITEADILEGFSAFSGRLSVNTDGSLDYCAGQYYPTEFRAAVCAVCSSVIWDQLRDGLDTGDEIRKAAKRLFGQGIAKRWF